MPKKKVTKEEQTEEKTLEVGVAIPAGEEPEAEAALPPSDDAPKDGEADPDPAVEEDEGGEEPEILGLERVDAGKLPEDSDPVLPDLPAIPYGEDGAAPADLSGSPDVPPPPAEELLPADGAEEDTPVARRTGAPTSRPMTAREMERKAFFDLDFHELDRGLTPEERQEWQTIYASFRGQSVIRGRIMGVDPYMMLRRDPATGETRRVPVYCAVVVPYRVRVLIPEEEMWTTPNERPSYVFRSVDNAIVDFVVIGLDRPGRSVIGSRRKALRNRRYFFANQPALHSVGARVTCDLLAVGPRRCLASCYGYDIDLTQRELSYTAIPDLREKYHPGDTLDCIVKDYDRQRRSLTISVKETVPNPFIDAEYRHPVGAHRTAVISGKYAGGVFCNLPDGLTVLCNYAFHYTDADFNVWDKVIVSIIRYDNEKKQTFGKIIMKR